MTEEENNLLLGLLGTGVAIVLAWFGMQNKPAQASQASASAQAPKMKTGCGCGH